MIQVEEAVGQLLPEGGDGLDTDRQLSPVPVSWMIPKSMRRINWLAAGTACAGLADGIWTLAVPVDNATAPNHLLVWDARTNEWQGEDQLDGEDENGLWADTWVVALPPLQTNGRETQGIVQRTRTLYQGVTARETSPTTTRPLTTRVKFRGYALQDMGLKRMDRLEVETQEHGTEGLTLEAHYDGRHSAVAVQTSTTRDRSRWLTWGRAPRTLDNAGADFMTEDREDYSWMVQDAVEIHDPGITLGVMQAHRNGGAVSGVTRLVSPVLAAAGGRVRIHVIRAAGISVE